jgi:hypothetical protein
MHNLHAFLDRFYMSRIGIRMLIGGLMSISLDIYFCQDDFEYIRRPAPRTV